MLDFADDVIGFDWRGNASEAMKITRYNTELTDMLPKPVPRGRPIKRLTVHPQCHSLSCQIRLSVTLSVRRFSNWKTVYHVFRQWTTHHRWAVIHDTLHTLVRRTHGKRSRPTAAILDSQSVKSDGDCGRVGYDAGKEIKGCKRHLRVDILGLVLGVTITPASTTERDGAQLLLYRPQLRPVG